MGGVTEQATGTEGRDTAAEVAVRPLTPRLGAVVEGVDTRRPLDDATAAVVLDALMAYKVLFFERQELSLDEQRRFAAHFGEPFADPLTPAFDGQAGMSSVTRVDHFHSDHMHLADPPKFSMLSLTTVPPLGGDTIWADLVAGYEALSEPMRDFLEGLTALHVSRDPWDDTDVRYGAFLGHDLADEERAAIRAALVPHAHPLVRLLPETGKPNYWVCRRFTRAIQELDPAESDAVLGFLFAHQLRPEFVVRWRWHAGDLAFWDHRTTVHAGVADYGDAERFGQRASIAGGRPVPARPVR
ncbi:MAG: TauD/TfdA dioxygenase family protein [Acidimicrobiales bacterium]